MATENIIAVDSSQNRQRPGRSYCDALAREDKALLHSAGSDLWRIRREFLVGTGRQFGSHPRNGALGRKSCLVAEYLPIVTAIRSLRATINSDLPRQKSVSSRAMFAQYDGDSV